MKNITFFSLLLVFAIAALVDRVGAEDKVDDIARILNTENLVAWCIVPFDAKSRTPDERAAMLKDLGIKRCAYDWRAEHIPSFEQEILAYQKHGIEFFAFWGVQEKAFELFDQYDLHPQIWQTLRDPGEQSENGKVQVAADRLEPLAKRTQKMGCKLGLYNHGGWGGEPRNLVAVCQELRSRGYSNVGIVYNFHHGHGHIDDWSTSFALMKDFLHCLNLNGMNENAQPKILPLGQGEHELEMIREVTTSDYKGPIGILDHRSELDARKSLQENLVGLEWIRREIREPGQGGPKAKPNKDPSAPESNSPERTTSMQSPAFLIPGKE